MTFSCGIVGLPNVGKSTIFNALTNSKVAAENFPFCTIEANTGVVPIRDIRLQRLAQLAKSAKIIPAQITFVDIAGLIEGASKGEGLGNKFLGHIRGVNAIAHVVRCFSDPEVTHVYGSIDPLRDIQVIETEIILADLQSVENQVNKYEKIAKSGAKEARERLTALKELSNHLGRGLPAREVSEDVKETLSDLMGNLLSMKPVMYVLNVDENLAGYQMGGTGNDDIEKVTAYAKERGSETVVICGEIESQLVDLTEEEREEYLKELGWDRTGLERMAIAGFRLLSLITFFTVGPKEAHAWTVKKGTLAPQAAGKIHSDFERGFIRAEVIKYEDFVRYGSELKAKEAGKMRVEGKDYEIQDGDIIHFRVAT